MPSPPAPWVDSLTETLVRTALRPLLRIGLAAGFSAAQVARWVEEESIGVASTLLRAELRKPRATDLAVLTGVSRMVIRQWRGRVKARRAAPARAGVQVLRGWYRDPAYLNEAGRPQDLPILGSHGFKALVGRYGSDTTHGAVLRDLLQTGAVVRLKTGLVRVHSRSLSIWVPHRALFAQATHHAERALERIERSLPRVKSVTARYRPAGSVPNRPARRRKAPRHP